jgi:RNA-directed DNA polymerase
MQSDKMTVRLARFSDVPIRRHIKVRENKSWYDGDWTYWATRRSHYPTTNFQEAALLKQQRGRCPICRSVFDVHDALEQDHVWTKTKDGLEGYHNLQLVHRSCHHRKTRWDSQAVVRFVLGVGKRQEGSRVKGNLHARV